MIWKAIYTDGTEIRENDVVQGKEVDVLHDGLPTGEKVPARYGVRYLDPTRLAQFILYGDSETPIGHLLFDEAERGQCFPIYRKRLKKNLLTGEVSDTCYLLGKLYRTGFIDLAEVGLQGEEDAPVAPDLMLLEEELAILS